MHNKKVKVRYSDNPELGELQIIEDFLPPPEQLIFRPKGVKVTLTLSEDSVNFFKEQGERLRTPLDVTQLTECRVDLPGSESLRRE